MKTGACGAGGGNGEEREGRGESGVEEKIRMVRRRSAGGGGCWGGKWGEARRVGANSALAMTTMNTHRERVASSRGVRCRMHALGAMDHVTMLEAVRDGANELACIADGSSSYSKSSYYTALGLFLFSLPGLWSLIKRSTKSKIVKKSYEIPGPSVPGGVELDETARKIAGYFKAKNYEMETAGQKVIFEGKYEPNFGQATYITFCAFIGLGSFALVLSIVQQDVGGYWYLMTLLAPAAGYYYWSKSGRVEKIEVKMVTADDDATTDIIILGDDEEVERFRKELELMEKGKVYVKGILEQQ